MANDKLTTIVCALAVAVVLAMAGSTQALPAPAVWRPVPQPSEVDYAVKAALLRAIKFVRAAKAELDHSVSSARIWVSSVTELLHEQRGKAAEAQRRLDAAFSLLKQREAAILVAKVNVNTATSLVAELQGKVTEAQTAVNRGREVVNKAALVVEAAQALVNTPCIVRSCHHTDSSCLAANAACETSRAAAQRSLEAAKAALASAQTMLSKAQSALDDVLSALNASQKQLDAAKRALTEAIQARDQQAAAVEEAKRALQEIQARLRQLEAELEEAKQELQRALEELAHFVELFRVLLQASEWVEAQGIHRVIALTNIRVFGSTITLTARILGRSTSETLRIVFAGSSIDVDWLGQQVCDILFPGFEFIFHDHGFIDFTAAHTDDILLAELNDDSRVEQQDAPVLATTTTEAPVTTTAAPASQQ